MVAKRLLMITTQKYNKHTTTIMSRHCPTLQQFCTLTPWVGQQRPQIMVPTWFCPVWSTVWHFMLAWYLPLGSTNFLQYYCAGGVSFLQNTFLPFKFLSVDNNSTIKRSIVLGFQRRESVRCLKIVAIPAWEIAPIIIHPFAPTKLANRMDEYYCQTPLNHLHT